MPCMEMPPCAPISSPTSIGVAKMPIRLEAEAAHTAPALLPRAIEVKAIEDCTVEGSVVRKRTPG